MAKAPKKNSAWPLVNVLQIRPEARKIWQFHTSGNFDKPREITAPGHGSMPESFVGKSWGHFFRPKLNVAWLPAEKVYLRAIQLPAADYPELKSMVDLQLEKISPMPPNQVVWSLEVLPAREDGLQTVIVVVVARNLVEEHLGQLEGQGFLADRLEIPMLDQLLATPVTKDGLWIFPGVASLNSCLIAWWYGGVLQNLTLLSWASFTEQGSSLKDYLAQMTWTGEIEGWLTSPPNVHLVADSDIAALWEPRVSQWLGQSVELVAPVDQARLASLTARRAAFSPPDSSLTPPEHRAKYRNLYVDRLWMSGLFALVILYIVGLLVYFTALTVLKIQNSRLQDIVASRSLNYTNAIQLKEKLQITRERNALKYAALECWKAAVENLPTEMTLTGLTFSRGTKITLYGTVPQEAISKLTDYNEAMTKVPINGTFLTVKPPNSQAPRPNAAGVLSVTWSFDCELPN